MRKLAVVVFALVFVATFSAPASAQVLLGLDRLLFVSAGGTPSANCAGLRASIDQITDADFDRPYELILGPGDYDCGDQPLVMKALVSLEGQGSSILGNVAGGPVVRMAPFTALSELGVSNAASDGAAVEVVDLPTGLPLLDRVSLIGSPALKVHNSGIVTVRDSTLQPQPTSAAGNSVVATDSTLSFRNSRLFGQSAGRTAIDASGSTVFFEFSRLEFGKKGSATFSCRYVYDRTTPLDNSCNPI